MPPRHRRPLAGVLLLGLVEAACTTVPIMDPLEANLPASPSRADVAVVSIHYDANRYEIRYADSTNLDHQGDRIHRNHNSWVKNLDARIRNQLGYG